MVEGYATVYNLDGETVHTVGMWEEDNPEAYIDYEVDVGKVPEPQRDDINILLGDRETLESLLDE